MIIRSVLIGLTAFLRGPDGHFLPFAVVRLAADLPECSDPYLVLPVLLQFLQSHHSFLRLFALPVYGF